MLSEHHRQQVKATVPLLEAGGEALTRHFYGVMLSEHPEVRPLFNQAHQASGAQPRALANGILQYARHIDRLDTLGPLVGQIVQKHVSLQVLPEQYPIVGSCLLRAIREVLGPDIATDAVIEAWAAAYQQLADLLIGAEEDVYAAAAATRRSLDRVSVPVWLIILSDQLTIAASGLEQNLGLKKMSTKTKSAVF